MTREEILAMRPGVQMDKLVATLVMGYEVDERKELRSDRVAVFKKKGCKVQQGELFHPSTSIVAAWEVIEHEQKEWSWDMAMFNESGEIEVRIGRGNSVSVYAPEAICKAALLNKWFQTHNLWGQGTTEALIPTQPHG